MTPAINSSGKKTKIVVLAQFFKIHKTWSIHFAVLQRKDTKFTKIYNAHARLLFASLDLLFGGVLVAFAVPVCVSFLLRKVYDLLGTYLTSNEEGITISVEFHFSWDCGHDLFRSYYKKRKKEIIMICSECFVYALCNSSTLLKPTETKVKFFQT